MKVTFDSLVKMYFSTYIIEYLVRIYAKIIKINYLLLYVHIILICFAVDFEILTYLDFQIFNFFLGSKAFVSDNGKNRQLSKLLKLLSKYVITFEFRLV